ncbi:MAG TPA: hypothetical protein VG892_07735 [Terriglobales bacterium]|nr:hypothetical protein [Terriglobales bacterium]
MNRLSDEDVINEYIALQTVREATDRYIKEMTQAASRTSLRRNQIMDLILAVKDEVPGHVDWDEAISLARGDK